MDMKVFELVPTNGRKSFGGKAKVIEENGVMQLKSYDTIVAEYNLRDKTMQVFGIYSNTTVIHIKYFLELCGFEKLTKAEIVKKYNIKSK